MHFLSNKDFKNNYLPTNSQWNKHVDPNPKPQHAMTMQVPLHFPKVKPMNVKHITCANK